jgi:hypothetical protein
MSFQNTLCKLADIQSQAVLHPKSVILQFIWWKSALTEDHDQETFILLNQLSSKGAVMELTFWHVFFAYYFLSHPTSSRLLHSLILD